MRKFLIFLFVALLLLASQLNGFALQTKKFGGGYSVYSGGNITDEYTLSSYEVVLQQLKKGNVNGECVRFIGKDKDIDSFINEFNIRVVDEQNLSNIRVVYGYTSRFGEGVTLDGKRVNVQIAKRGGTITIGTPMICGSF